MKSARLFALLLLALPVLAHAQIANPVKWTFTSKKINATTYELHMTATIAANWHLYAQEAGEGPVPTTFKFTRNPLVTTSGKVKEDGKLHKSFDKNFDSELKYYEKQVNFIQTVTIKGKVTTNVKGSVEFMVCDDHQCLPPKEIEFSISVGGK
jgi:thiol:disulfide interchange protein DsbD